MSHSPDTIPYDQNNAARLDFLAGVSYFYGRAKVIRAVQIILTALIPVIFSVTSVFAEEFKVYAALYGIIIAMVDIAVLTEWQRSYKREAAGMQECFDCEVLKLNWNSFKVGSQIRVLEKVPGAAARYKQKNDLEKKKDWYTADAVRLPEHVARVVCQRTTILWDVELRRRYWIGLAIIASVIVLSVIILGLLRGMTLEELIISVLTPILPAILWSIREIKRQIESIQTLKRLLTYAEELIDEALNADVDDLEIKAKSRSLQDELYVHRHSNEPVFNWIYNLMQDRYDKEVNEAVKTLVDRALQALSKPIGTRTLK